MVVVVVHRSRLAEYGLKLAARSPVEAGIHKPVEVVDHILAEAADHNLAGDVHNLAAEVGIPAVAGVAGGTVVDHSPQKHHTAQVAELHTVLGAVLRSHLLDCAILTRPECRTKNQLRLGAS